MNLNRKQIRERVYQVAEEIAEKHGLVLFDVEYGRQNGNYVLSVYIDKPGGVTLEDCEKVHVELNRVLDDMDPIPHKYYLQVSSPGLDRPLRTENALRHSVGKQVKAKTYTLIDGRKRFAGQLQEVDDESIVLNTESGLVKISRDKIASIRLSSDL